MERQRLLKKIGGWGIFMVILWGFLFYVQGGLLPAPISTRIVRALIYALAIGGMLYLVQSVVIERLRPFSTNIQLLLKFLFYAAAIFFSYLFLLFIDFYFFRAGARPLWPSTNVFGILAQLFSAPVSGLNIRFLLPDWALSLLTFIVPLMAMIIIVSLTFSLIDTKWHQFKAEKQLSETRLRLLEMQLKPHFLFNTLNAIVSVVRSDPPKAEKLLIEFSDFLRYNFDFAGRQTITLKEEIRFTTLYLSLLQMRFGNLIWQINADEKCESVEVPVLLLQPLAENAVKHGWQNRDGELKITIECDQTKEGLLIKVTDNGDGMGAQQLQKFPPTGHAVHNLQERLRLLYGRDHLLEVETAPGQGTQIRIRIPQGVI